MTPEEFRQNVLPGIVTAWDKQCFCAAPGFQKLLSFDFRNYGIAPTGLADTEILINALIRQRFTPQDEPEKGTGERAQDYLCPQCQARCTEVYSEFSIHMYQTTVTYQAIPALAPVGHYLVGFYGLKQADFLKVTDFERTSSVEAFLAQLQTP